VRAGGFPGADTILQQLAAGVSRKRVGLSSQEKVPVREGAVIVDAEGNPLGTVTSGGVGPSAGGPIAMAYLPTSHTALGTTVYAQVRGKNILMKVSKMPFVAQRYYRG
jgi:aminomethyltransferase